MGRLTESFEGIFLLEPVHGVDEELSRLRAWARDASSNASISRLEIKLREHSRIYEDVCDLLDDFKEEVASFKTGML